MESLCLAYGVKTPQLLIIESPKIDAIAFGLNKKRTILAITSATYENLNPVELEAVLAHELSRIRLGITGRETYITALLKLPFGNLFNNLCSYLIKIDTIMAADIDGMKITRYPPGIITALINITEQPKKADTTAYLSVARYGSERILALREFWELDV